MLDTRLGICQWLKGRGRTAPEQHGGWSSLQQNIFAAGNFTSFQTGSLFGLNNTFGDLDMLPMSSTISLSPINIENENI